jgi:hypothetical protein
MTDSNNKIHLDIANKLGSIQSSIDNLHLTTTDVKDELKTLNGRVRRNSENLVKMDESKLDKSYFNKWSMKVTAILIVLIGGASNSDKLIALLKSLF